MKKLLLSLFLCIGLSALAAENYTAPLTSIPVTVQALSDDATITVDLTDKSDLVYAQDKVITWMGMEGIYTFNTTAIVGGQFVYPRSYADGLRLYNTYGHVVTVNAPEGYYFVEVEYVLADAANHITINGTDCCLKGDKYKFNSQATSFTMESVQHDATNKYSAVEEMTFIIHRLPPEQDYYFAGDNNSWANGEEAFKFTSNGDGTYALTLNENLEGQFLITDGTWDNKWGGGEILLAGTTYNLTKDGNNIVVAGSIANPKLILNPEANTILVEGVATYVYEYGIRGNFASQWETINMTEVDGAWVVENVEVSNAAAEFGITKIDSLSKAQLAWLYGETGTTIDSGDTYQSKLQEGDNGANFAIAPGVWSFSFDPETLVLTATLESSNEPEKVTIYGNYNLAYSGNHTHVYYWGGTVSTDWPGDAMETTVGSDGKIYKVFNVGDSKAVIFNDNGSNQTADLLYSGSYIMNDFGNTTTEVEFAPEGTPDYSTWYLNVVGDFNDWKDNGIHFDAEGNAVHENLPIGNKGFKIKVGTGADVLWYSTGTEITVGESVVINGNADANMTIKDAVENGSYNVSFNVHARTIEITPYDNTTTGIEDVNVENSEVRYYNLQGVQVANPAAGNIYIRMQGNKATKVVF